MNDELKTKLRGLQAGSTMWLIVHQLFENGPMTARELIAATGCQRVNPQIATQCQNGRLFLAGYRRDDDGGRTYIRALYDVKPPAKPPTKPRKLNSTERAQRLRRRQKVVSSVFALGGVGKITRVLAKTV